MNYEDEDVIIRVIVSNVDKGASVAGSGLNEFLAVVVTSYLGMKLLSTLTTIVGGVYIAR